jgi:hypothetical protein
MQSLKCLLIGSVFALSARAADYYVSPTGSGSDCSLDAPCSVSFALDRSHSPAQPGDTIWLRGGTYRGTVRCDLAGLPMNPILVRQMPGERAVLDGGNSGGDAVLTVAAKWTWFQGFEITSLDPQRYSSVAGSWPSDLGRGEGVTFEQVAGEGVGVKLINLIIHDVRQGVSLWKEAIGAEVYGCLIFYNGWEAPDREHGHGIYTQNDKGIKRIADNIIFDQFSHGIHAYGSDAAPLNNYQVEGNVIFNNGALSSAVAVRNILIGGGNVAHNLTLANNYTYYSPAAGGGSNELGYDAPVDGLMATGNYFISGDKALQMYGAMNAVMTSNTFWGKLDGFSASQYPANTYLLGSPSGITTVVRPNRYEAGRGHVVVWNWGMQASAAVDLAGILDIGDTYEVRDAQNYFGTAVAGGVFDGNAVHLPLDGNATTAPVGATPRPAVHTPPEFGVFVVIKGSSASAAQNGRRKRPVLRGGHPQTN